MKSISQFCVLFLFFVSGALVAQTVDVKGKVTAEDDLEGIHVINKSALKFTITNNKGEFVIPAKLNDTIVFSGVQYQPKEIVVTPLIVQSKTLAVYLIEQVNELDEVIVGKILTGNLMSDVENFEAERDIDFYDLGIPGYTGVPKTQSERRLVEATTGGGFLPLNPILNGISGRTKMLKNQIKLENLDECMYRVKSNFSELLFRDYELAEAYQMEFFYFASEDTEFPNLCKINNDIATYEFLKQKLMAFKSNLKTKKE